MNTIPEGYLKDSRGRLVPIESIPAADLARDELVREIAAKARALSETIRQFKSAALDDIDAFVSLSAERYGVDLGGAKGNLTLTSFDGRIKILRAIAEKLEFDERLQAAKALIDECLAEWGAGARKEIRTIITDAFNVDKQGKINTARVLTLRRYNFDDEKWQRAMAAISDSLSVAVSRTYIRVYTLNEETGKYDQLPLDLSSV